jgi:hypothetical protein
MFQKLSNRGSLGRTPWLARWLASSICLAACSAYDSNLLLGATGAASGPTTAGTRAVAPFLSDGCPDGTTDCGSCGDLIVQSGETCDPPESCLTTETCLAPSACVEAHLSGTPESCTARCELRAITRCRPGDGCCPAGCSVSEDDDCSETCGNGVVESNETCEPDSATQPCDEPCDDGDPCTEDQTTGSPENCNVDCAFIPIVAPNAEDGCCPPDASMESDTDCAPRCGNGVLESGEQCDGEADCDDDCKRARIADADLCAAAMEAVADLGDACRVCACERCSGQVAECLMTGDAEHDAGCGTVIECTHRTGCGNGTCYCGASLLGCSTPNGACKTEIEAAVGSTDPNVALGQCMRDPDCPVNRAYAYDACMQTSCRTACNSTR